MLLSFGSELALVSCFRATGLHPFNSTEGLKRFSDGLDGDGEEVERNIDASLKELMQEYRRPNY